MEVWIYIGILAGAELLFAMLWLVGSIISDLLWLRRRVDTELLELLLEAQRSRHQVEIVVSSCLYACCGARAWIPRSGYEQTYHGVIADVDVEAGRFLLHAIAVSSLSYAVAGDISSLEELRPLVD